MKAGWMRVGGGWFVLRGGWGMVREVMRDWDGLDGIGELRREGRWRGWEGRGEAEKDCWIGAAAGGEILMIDLGLMIGLG